MVRFVVLVLMLGLSALAVAGCAVRSEGEAPEPIVDPVAATSVAGAAAVSLADIDVLSCDGVLVPPADDLSLEVHAHTEVASRSQPDLVSMCSAVYEVEVPGGEFLSVTLMQFESDNSAVGHYELMKNTFLESGVPISEINNADEGLVDQVSGLMDRDGIGRTTVMRQREWVVAVSVGPTTGEARWGVGDIELIGRGVLDRVR